MLRRSLLLGGEPGLCRQPAADGRPGSVAGPPDGQLALVAHVFAGSEASLFTRPSWERVRHLPLSVEDAYVAAHRARGASIKMLALDLSCSRSATSRFLERAMRKLEIRSEADLVTLFLPVDADPTSGAEAAVPAANIQQAYVAPRNGLCASATTDDGLVVLRYPTPPWPIPGDLTSAEMSIVRHLIEGATAAEIAAARGTSPRTIANQVASVFQKLGVQSRIELLAALRTRPLARVRSDRAAFMAEGKIAPP